MEYEGPGSGYDLSDKPTFEERMETFLVEAYPILMPIIIFVVSVCLAVAVGGK